jgi:hypothetical protein
MPKKIRELKAMLKKAGFLSRSAKGHSFWWHGVVKSASVTLCGNDGDDAKRYLEKEVEIAIKKAGGQA